MNIRKAMATLGLVACVAAAHAGPAEPWRLEADLAYGTDPAQRVDAYIPARPNGDAILLVHGGGWRNGDKATRQVIHNKVAHWSAQGALVVSVNYRLLPQADPMQQAGDVATALAYAQRHARGWGADPARFVLVGHSAGAHLVALLDADPRLAQAHGADAWRGTVALDSAALDVEAIMGARHPRLYDQAFGTDPRYWRKASPEARLTRDAPPILLVCSSKRATSCAQSRGFTAAAKRLGVRVEVLPQPLSHGQVNDALGLPGAYTTAVDAFMASLPPARAGGRTTLPHQIRTRSSGARYMACPSCAFHASYHASMLRTVIAR